MYKKLLFGTAGIPISSKPGIINGIKRVRELNLDAMEIEFVRGVFMKKELAIKVNQVRKELGLELTCHAPYYINLNAKEKAKYEASINRILDSAKILYFAGGKSVTFHAAYYMNETKSNVYNKVKAALKEVERKLDEEGINVMIRPELTGKPTQFGDLDELIKISQELEHVLPCIDFAHLHARSLGRYNSYQEFTEVLRKLEEGLGKEILKNMHIHVSGIAYNEKGEKHHLNLEESDFKYEELLKSFKDYKVRGIVISESPNIEGDAMLMKKFWEQIK